MCVCTCACVCTCTRVRAGCRPELSAWVASRGPWALDMLRLLPPLLRHCPQVASHKGDPDSRFLGAGGKRPGVWGRAGHPDVAPAPSSWETPSSLGTPALRGALREVPAEPAEAGETVTTRRDTPRHRGLFPWPEGHVGTAHLWFPQVSPQRWNLNSDTGSQGSRPRRWRGGGGGDAGRTDPLSEAAWAPVPNS